MDRAARDYGLVFRPHTAADAEALKAEEYDAIIFAVGSAESRLSLPGAETAKIVQATELLVKPELLGDAKNVVVVGAGVVGCETAHWLKYEQGREATVVEMTPFIMNKVCTANRGYLIHHLHAAG